MSEQKATNVHWHGGEINRRERSQLLGHGGATLWFTGLSGSGKSTIAVALDKRSISVACWFTGSMETTFVWVSTRT